MSTEITEITGDGENLQGKPQPSWWRWENTRWLLMPATVIAVGVWTWIINDLVSKTELENLQSEVENLQQEVRRDADLLRGDIRELRQDIRMLINRDRYPESP